MEEENIKNWEKEFRALLEEFEIKMKDKPENTFETIIMANPYNVLMVNIRLLLAQEKKKWQEKLKEKIEEIEMPSHPIEEGMTNGRNEAMQEGAKIGFNDAKNQILELLK